MPTIPCSPPSIVSSSPGWCGRTGGGADKRKNAPPALARGESIRHAGGRQHTENHVAHLCIFVEDAASCLRLTALVYQCVQTALLQSLVPSVQGGTANDRQGFPRPLLRSGLAGLPECAESLAGVADGYLPGDTLLVVSPQARPPLPSPRPSPSDPAQGRERGAFCGSACSRWRLSSQERAAWVWAVQVGGFSPAPRPVGL